MIVARTETDWVRDEGVSGLGLLVMLFGCIAACDICRGAEAGVSWKAKGSACAGEEALFVGNKLDNRFGGIKILVLGAAAEALVRWKTLLLAGDADLSLVGDGVVFEKLR